MRVGGNEVGVGVGVAVGVGVGVTVGGSVGVLRRVGLGGTMVGLMDVVVAVTVASAAALRCVSRVDVAPHPASVIAPNKTPYANICRDPGHGNRDIPYARRMHTQRLKLKGRLLPALPAVRYCFTAHLIFLDHWLSSTGRLRPDLTVRLHFLCAYSDFQPRMTVASRSTLLATKNAT